MMFGYARADCYPGDTAYTSIVQDIYHDATSDKIQLSGSDQPAGTISRYHLCSILRQHHNYGKNPGQSDTNSEFVGITMEQSACTNALYYPKGYNGISGWQQWAGYYSGNWYNTVSPESDGAQWSYPSIKDVIYALQPVRFDSQYRIDNCVTPNSTGATCRYGWNQSGQGVSYRLDEVLNNCNGASLQGTSWGRVLCPYSGAYLQGTSWGCPLYSGASLQGTS